MYMWLACRAGPGSVSACDGPREWMKESRHDAHCITFMAIDVRQSKGFGCQY